MFGYVNVNRDELSEQDRKTYQKYYCGLCRELKNLAGTKGQMLLNYDSAFLSILLSGLYELPEEEERFFCRFHPMSKKYSISNDAVRYAAAMDIVLSYYNFIDDYMDDGNRTKKRFSEMLKPVYDKIKIEYPRQVKAVEDYIMKLNRAEKAMEPNLDKVSNFTGEVMAELFQWKEDDIWNEDLKNMGFYLGKYIYILDAYEDREKDEKKGEYNPLIAMWRSCGASYEVCIQQTMTALMSECAKSFERMPVLMNSGILRNIIYSGVWSRYEYIQLKRRDKIKKKKIS
ncbi:MAG: hypothetical protein II169_01635 [Lachnospiraceae bacterium]|nr:hypothetical protein [Lachnospiraceae bacterium]